MKNNNTTIAVAMSGGVDSSVSAALLKEQGYNVLGFYMKNWADTQGLKSSDCPWLADREDAMRVCAKLDIPFSTLDFEKQYRDQVLDYFFSEYKKGRTPNPDIMCNSKIKFGVFLDEALRLGADYIATGHYARVNPVILNEAKQSEESRESCSSDFDEILHCVQDDDIKLGILVAYGDIIPKKIIDSFPLGILNLHPSLLPKYRGSSPIQSAILNQDKQTGVTIMKLDDKMDHGPVVAQQTVKLDQTETTGELHNKLAIIGADLMIKILPDYIAGKIELKEQNHDKATFTEKLSKKDGKIDWNSTAQVEPLVRAMNPWPGAWTIYKDKKLIIWSTQKDNTPKEVQLEGKKKMAFKEFLKGHPDFEITDSFLSR